MEELFNAISEINPLRVQEILYSDQNLNINQVNELGQNAFHVAANAIKEKKKINLEGITTIEVTNSSNPEYNGILNVQSIASSSTIYCDLEYDVYNVTNGTRVLLRRAHPSSTKDIIDILELLINKFPNHLNVLDAKGNSPLNLALSSEHIETIKLLIQNGATANLSAKDEYGNTPLHQIILLKDCDNIEILELLIQTAKNNGHDQELIQSLNATNQGGKSFICSAVNSYNPSELLKLLVDNGANIHALNQYGQTALYYARTVEATKALLKYGVNLFTIDINGNTVFHNAAAYGNIEILELLIQTAKNNGHDQELIQSLNATNQGGNSVICSAVNSYNPSELLKLLVDNGANIHALNQYGQTALYYARTVEATKALLKYGVNLFTIDINGNTVFHNGNVYGNIEILELLIQTAKNNGHDQELIQSLNATSKWGDSLIYKAANTYDNPEEKLELLIQNGADVDARNKNDETALHKCLNTNAWWEDRNTGNISAVESLLSVGANPNIPNGYGNYPIHLAAQKENFKELCKLLLLAGANVNTTDANGNTLGDLIINRVDQNDAEALVTAGNDAAELYDFAESITVLTNDFSINNSSEALYNFPLPFPNRYLIYKKIFGSNFPSKNSLQKFLTQNIFTTEDGEASYNKTLIPKCDDAKILNIPYNILKEELDIFTINNEIKFLTDLHNNMWKTIALTTSYNTTAKNDVFGNENLVNLILNYVGGDVKPHKGLATLKTLLEQYPDNEGNFEPKESEITTLTTVHPYEETKECDIPSLGETTNNLQEYQI